MRDDGFTLVEVLVALAVFSLAALALLRLQGAAVGTAARLDERTVGAIVARNQAVELLTDAVAPAYGTTGGIEHNAGRPWRWTRIVRRTADPRLQRIDIAVIAAGGGQAATLTVVRRVL